MFLPTKEQPNKKPKSAIELAELAYKKAKHLNNMFNDSLDECKKAVDTLDRGVFMEEIKRIKALLKLLNDSTTEFYIQSKQHMDSVIEKFKKEE